MYFGSCTLEMFSAIGTVLGAVVMEAFYVVFDRHNSRIGFAKSTCPNRDPNTVTSHVKGPYLFSGKIVIFK